MDWNSHETLALLEQWNEAVSQSMEKLYDYEQEEIKKFHGPDDLEADIRERLRLHAHGKLRDILSQINPFFGVLQQLLLLCASIMPTRSMSLALVSGGAYLAAKVSDAFNIPSSHVLVIDTLEWPGVLTKLSRDMQNLMKRQKGLSKFWTTSKSSSSWPRTTPRLWRRIYTDKA